jgi:hypothetical protein
VHGTVELTPRRTDLGALVARVVEESEIGVDNEVKVVAESVALTVDPMRVEQILAGLLRGAAERTPSGKTVIVRLAQSPDGVVLSVEDPEPASDAAMSPVVRRLAEIQGGSAEVVGRDGGGSAFTVHLPDLANGLPRADRPTDASEADVAAGEPREDPPIVVDEVPATIEPTAEQILSQELRRLAEAESEARRPAETSGRRKRR